jgi:hypothetical protein
MIKAPMTILGFTALAPRLLSNLDVYIFIISSYGNRKDIGLPTQLNPSVGRIGFKLVKIREFGYFGLELRGIVDHKSNDIHFYTSKLALKLKKDTFLSEDQLVTLI